MTWAMNFVVPFLRGHHPLKFIQTLQHGNSIPGNFYKRNNSKEEVDISLYVLRCLWENHL